MSMHEQAPAGARRILLPAGTREPRYPDHPLWNRGWWRARWLTAPVPSALLAHAGAAAVAGPYVMAYRLRVTLDAPARLRIHVSGDERYTLFVDGTRVHHGPERGHPGAWRFASIDLDWSSGTHWLALRLWVANTLVTTGYTLTNLGLMVRLLQGRSLKLPGFSPLSRRLP